MQRYFKSALKDFRIASQSKVPEVTFRFCYDALLKTAIAVCAQSGLRVKAQKGHHYELINKLAEFLKDQDINVIGNEMRSKRNWDLYSGGIAISRKEAAEYIGWLRIIFRRAEKYLTDTNQSRLL